MVALTLHGWWVYARGFSDAKFASVRVGVTEADVVRILGRPLSVDRAEERLYKVAIASGEVVPVVIRYDERGNVSPDSPRSEVMQNRRIQVSTTRGDAERALHTRGSVHFRFLDYWHYAEPRGFTWDFHRRDIVLDPSRKVVEKHQSDLVD